MSATTATPPPIDRSFRVWAPHPDRVRLWLDGGVHPMFVDDAGWWSANVDAGAGARYGFLLDDDDTVLPDPRSAWQPDGVHGPSAVLGRPSEARDPQKDCQWRGRELHGSVVYELHVGTFTDEGTLDAAADRLCHLAELGVGFVELMPVNAFNGTHGWGYDGVGWFAVHEPYGGPSGLERFVARAHELGLGVLLDVVHNHFGPSGNYLGRFGPYETDVDDGTPWGRAVNLSGAGSFEVRRFVLDNIAWWLRRFDIDGLRMDAVHALVDTSDEHVLAEAAREVDALAVELGRPLSLIAESDLNDAILVTRRHDGGYGLTAQWNDDVHHAIHSIVSGERQGYYADFGSPQCLATVLTHGFFHAGTFSSFRGRVHGHPIDPAVVSPWRLVAFTSTHDQVGNRAQGDRPAEYLTTGQLAIKAALVLFSSFTPMLFMGEEWGARTPFRYFSSHPERELATAVLEGRRAEFAEHGWPPGDVPDPQELTTFSDSKLDWAEAARPEHARLLRTYRELIRLRTNLGSDTDFRDVSCEHPEQPTWFIVRRNDHALVVNFADHEVAAPVTGTPVLSWGEPQVRHDSMVLSGHSFTVIREPVIVR